MVDPLVLLSSVLTELSNLDGPRIKAFGNTAGGLRGGRGVPGPGEPGLQNVFRNV